MRYAYLDVLKVVAICFVVVIHTIGFKVVVFENSWEWFMASLFSMTARFAVPVFVMCSGAVFLGKSFESRSDIFQFYKKYLPLYFGYLFLGLLVAKGLSMFCGQDYFLLRGVLYDFYLSFGSGMWFFFMFIGLILVVPILSVVVKNRFIALCFLGLWFLFCVIRPFFSDTIGLYRQYVSNMLFADHFVGYFVLGYFLATATYTIKTRYIVLILFVSLLCANIASYFHNLTIPNSTYFYYSNNPFVFAYAVSCFLLIKNLCSTQEASGWLLRKFSAGTVFVYIFHTTIQNTVSLGYLFSKDNIYLIIFVRVPIIIAFSYIASFAWMATWPLLKRLLIAIYQATLQSTTDRLVKRVSDFAQGITAKAGGLVVDVKKV